MVQFDKVIDFFSFECTLHTIFLSINLILFFFLKQKRGTVAVRLLLTYIPTIGTRIIIHPNQQSSKYVNHNTTMNKKNRSWGDMHRNAWKMKEGHLPESKVMKNISILYKRQLSKFRLNYYHERLKCLHKYSLHGKYYKLKSS